MTLSPGDTWGTPGPLPADAPVARSDRELAELVQAAPYTALTVALTAGDLCRSLGGRGDAESRLGGETTLLPVDVGEVVLDDRAPLLFVAHLTARGRFWKGQGLVAMNAEWLGEWRMAPRAHPGDGILDVVAGHLPPRQRLLARSKARLGEHLPHPNLRSSRAEQFEMRFETPRRVYLDSTYVGIHTELRIALRPGAVKVAV